jgi:hypothetical protein
MSSSVAAACCCSAPIKGSAMANAVVLDGRRPQHARELHSTEAVLSVLPRPTITCNVSRGVNCRPATASSNRRCDSASNCGRQPRCGDCPDTVSPCRCAAVSLALACPAAKSRQVRHR